jgi:hypothetical protein
MASYFNTRLFSPLSPLMLKNFYQVLGERLTPELAKDGRFSTFRTMLEAILNRRSFCFSRSQFACRCANSPSLPVIPAGNRTFTNDVR